MSQFYCECCQKSVPLGHRVQLDGLETVPICKVCWITIEPGARVCIAADLRHYQTVHSVLDDFQKLVRRSLGTDGDSESKGEFPFFGRN